MSEKTNNETVLESWKEIATYLQREERTARRWEKEEGLPVHRHRHLSRSSVYAYPSELEAWRANRQPAAEPARSTWWWPAPAFASTMTLALAIMMAGSGPHVGARVQAAEPKFQRIEVPTGLDGISALSPDGGKLAFVSGGYGGEVWIVPVHGKVSPNIAGEPEQLTHGAEAMQLGLAWSGNGQWIAYNRSFGEGRRPSEIHLVSALGGSTRKIDLPDLSDRGSHAYNYNLALSPDGRWLVFSLKQDGILKLFRAEVGSGKASPITNYAAREPAYSPDGDRVAYIKLAGSPEGSRSEVRVLSFSSGTDTLVTEIPVRARSPVWSPDGTHLAFSIEPGQDNRSKEVWIVAVSRSGAGTAEPVKIQLPENTFLPLAGWAKDNRIGVLLSGVPESGIYTLPLGGRMATRVTPVGAELMDPEWSRDGRRLLVRYGPGKLAYVPSDGGQPVEIPIQANPPIFVVSPGGGNQLSPDGQTIAIAAANATERLAHIWTLPAGGGEATQLTAGPLTDCFPAWSPDGKTVAFIRRRGEATKAIFNLFTIPSTGGEIKQITSDSDRVMQFGIGWSPDVSQIAYFSTDGKLKSVSSAGGSSRVITELAGLQPVRDVAWTSDGQALLFSANWKIYQVAVSGGEPTEIPTGLKARTLHLGLSPDDKRLAFTGVEGGQLELFLIENFLPELGAAGNEDRQ